jgi:hypothetical protein
MELTCEACVSAA